MGDVVAVDEKAERVTISHDDIPGLMGAMTMAFSVRSPQVLAAARPGTRVRFGLEQEGNDLIVTRIVPLGSPEGRPGIHDHTPHHGGVVAMVGMLHLEAVAAPAGRLRVYLTDVWRRPLPLTGVTGTVTLNLADGRHQLPLVVRDDALEAGGPPLAGREVAAHVQLTREGQPIEIGEIALMLSLRFGEMIGQARLDAAGEHGSPILLPFAAPDDDLVPIEIDVLHSQFETFLQPEPCSMTGPGRAPALWGPTCSFPPASTHAMLPPPLPISTISDTGVWMG